MRWVKRGHVRRVLFLVLCFLVFRKDLWRTLGRKRCLDKCMRYEAPVDLWLYNINGVVAMGGATTFQRAFRIPDIVLMFLRFVGAARALAYWRRRGHGKVATQRPRL